jgi:hypothetical protein
MVRRKESAPYKKGGALQYERIARIIIPGVPIFLLKYDRWVGTFPGLRQHWTSAASLCIKSLALILFSFVRVVWGLTHLSGTTLKVRHMREPFFVRLSDGSIQGRYEVIVFNKSYQIRHYRIEVIATTPVDVLGEEAPLGIDRYG